MERLCLIFLVFIYSSCQFPEDPENSWENARKHRLLAGVVNHAPYASTGSASFSGSEVDLLKAFAAKNGLEIEFIKGSESKLIDQMNKYQLHLIIGGFTKHTEWKKKAALSLPYDDKHVILLPKGENRLIYEVESFLYSIKKK